MESGMYLISRKRVRQVTKHGYSYKHDLTHTPSMLINAAHAYMTGEVNWWPFEKESFKLGDRIENLTNAGAMIAAAIDRLQPYEVGKVYESCSDISQGTFKVIRIQSLKSGTTNIYIIGLSGSIKPVKQSFMIGSIFDRNCKPINN